MNRITRWILLGLALMALVPLAQAAPATGPASAGFLDTIAGNFQASSSGWMTTAVNSAKGIFYGLAGLEFAWFGIQTALKKADIDDLITSFVFKAMALMFFFMLITEAPKWMPLIPESFQALGARFAGKTFTPSGVMQEGLNVVNALFKWLSAQGDALSFFKPSEVAKYAFSGMLLIAASAMILIGFGLLAIQLLMTLIEMYIVMGIGAVMLGFLGSRWTSTWGEKYFGYAVSVGVKIMIIYAICGLGEKIEAANLGYLNAYLADPSKILPPQNVMAMGATGLLFGVLGFMVPGLAGSLMNGSPSLSMGSAAGAAAGIVAGAAGAAAAGGAVAAKGLESMKALTNATVGAAAGGAGGGAGGIGGSMDRLAKLGSMTSGGSGGSGGGSLGGIGGSSGGSGSGSLGGIGGSGSLGGTSTVAANTARIGQSAQAMMEGKGISGPASTPLQSGGGSTPSQGQTTSAAPSGASASAKGGADALGAASDTGQGGAAERTDSGPKAGNGAAGFAKDALGHALSQAQRHDGTSGGLSIRLTHPEG